MAVSSEVNKRSGSGELETKASEVQVRKLQDEWTLYLRRDEKSRAKSWEESIEKITTINSIELFWSVMNRIVSPSSFSSGCDEMIFKQGIFPMAELHPNNLGCFCQLRVSLRNLSQPQSNNNSHPEGRNQIELFRKNQQERAAECVDSIWLTLCAMFLGCVNQELDEVVTGLIMQAKPNQQYRFQVWTQVTDQSIMNQLCQELNEKLHDICAKTDCQLNAKFDIQTHRIYK
ncbi:MAG: translation initiation factor eIF4E [Marteilia pararefringens]